MSTRKWLSALLLLGVSVATWADEASLRKVIEAAYPKFKVDSVVKTPYAGLYEVFMGGQIIYTALSSRSKYGKSGTAVMGVGPSFRLYPLDAAPLLFFSASVYMTSISSYSGDLSISGPTSSYGAVSIGYDILTSSMFAFEPYIEYRSRILENATAAGGVTFGVTFVSFHP